MTNRRYFLGGALAASALACFASAHVARVKRTRRAIVEFYPQTPGPNRPGTFTRKLGTPEAVELVTLDVGHFHGLTYERDGRIGYLYEAAVRGSSDRRGFVKFAGPESFPVA